MRVTIKHNRSRHRRVNITLKSKKHSIPTRSMESNYFVLMMLSVFAFAADAGLLSHVGNNIVADNNDFGFPSEICFGNPFCDDLFEQLSNNPSFLDQLEVRDVTNSGKDMSQNFNISEVDESKSVSRVSRSTNTPSCPSFTELYAQHGSRIKDRSFSPWRWQVNRDSTRIPANISETVCLCTRCINPITKEMDPSLMSVPMFLPRKVQYKNSDGTYREEIYLTALGCRCDFAIQL